VEAETWEEWFRAAWADREERVYSEVFGEAGTGICVLSPEIFLDVFKQETFDPRWMTIGVIELAPNAKHKSWVYVSSGLSNAWEDDLPDPTGVSGLGCEFLFESTVQGAWAVRLVQHLAAYQILLSCGRYGERPLVDLHDRLPLGAPLPVEGSQLTKLFVIEPTTWPKSFSIPSGRADFLQVVAITEAEAEFARNSGGDRLLELLAGSHGFPVTDPLRASVVASA